MSIIGSFCHLIEFQINDRRACNSPCRNRRYANASGWPRRGTHVGLYPDHKPVGSSLARSRDPLHISATLKKKIRC